MKIDINFTEIVSNRFPTIHHIPMTGRLYPEVYRELGYTAKVADLNRLILTNGHYTVEFVVSLEIDNDCKKMMARNSEDSARFWDLVDKVAVARLNNLVRYINRATW